MPPQNQQLVEIYNCPCRPQFTYKTKQTFKHHLNSDHHLSWQQQQDAVHLREKIVVLENTICSLKVECQFWKEAAIRYKHQYEPADFLLD